MKPQGGVIMSLAMAVITRDHADSIRDVLEQNAVLYKKYGIDVYYMDSGKDDSTEKLIEEYRADGYDNFYHVRCDESSSLDRKLSLALAQTEFNEKYDFVWPVKDRSFYDEQVFARIVDGLNREPDAVFLDFFANSQEGYRVYDDCRKFFYDCAFLTPDLETVVYNAKTLLSDYEPESEKEIIDDHKLWFSMVAVLFNRLARLPECRVEAFNLQGFVGNSDRSETTYKDRVFYVWKDCWLDVMDHCIDTVYDPYKAKVIKEATSLPEFFGHKCYINELRKKGALRKDNLEEVLHQWERVSDVPKEFLIQIVNEGYDPEKDLEALRIHLGEEGQVLLDLYNAVCKGIINKTNFPFDDFKTIMLEFFYKKYNLDIGVYSVKKGLMERTVQRMIIASEEEFMSVAEDGLFILINLLI